MAFEKVNCFGDRLSRSKIRFRIGVSDGKPKVYFGTPVLNSSFESKGEVYVSQLRSAIFFRPDRFLKLGQSRDEISSINFQIGFNIIGAVAEPTE